MAEEKKKTTKKVKVVEPEPTPYRIMYTQKFPDGKNYQLLVNPEDHRWYKAVETGKFQRAPRANGVWITTYGKPELLTESEIKFLDGE